MALMTKLRANTKAILVAAGVILVIGTVAASFAMAGSSGKAQSRYVAEINGTKIDREQFEKDFFFVWQQQNQMSYGQLTGLDQEPLRAQYLMQLLMREALLDEAKKLKLDATKEEIEAELKEIEDSVGGEEELIARLEMMGISLDTLKKDIKESLVFQKLQEELTKDVTVSDAELRSQLEEITASHILVEDEALANDLYQKLQDGADFADLAKENSVDPGSKDEGGELGSFGKGDMVKEFEDAAFALQEGEISKPVKTQYGYHIIKVTAHKTADEATLEEKKEEIEKTLLSSKKNEQLSKYITDLKDKSKIKIYDPQIRAWHEVNEGKIDEAIKSYTEALKDKPADSYIMASLAEAYQKKGDLDKAWDYYKQAAVNASEPALKINMAMVGNTKIQNIINAQETDEQKSIVEWAKENDEISTIYAEVSKALVEASEGANDNIWTHYQIAQIFNIFGDTENSQAEMDKIKAITEKLEAEEAEDGTADADTSGTDGASEE